MVPFFVTSTCHACSHAKFRPHSAPTLTCRAVATLAHTPIALCAIHDVAVSARALKAASRVHLALSSVGAGIGLARVCIRAMRRTFECHPSIHRPRNVQKSLAMPLPQCAAQCGKHAHLLGRMCRLGTPRLCKACRQAWSCKSRSPARCSCREMTDTQQGLCTDWGRMDRGAELQRKVMRSQVSVIYRSLLASLPAISGLFYNCRAVTIFSCAYSPSPTCLAGPSLAHPLAVIAACTIGCRTVGTGALLAAGSRVDLAFPGGCARVGLARVFKTSRWQGRWVVGSMGRGAGCCNPSSSQQASSFVQPKNRVV